MGPKNFSRRCSVPIAIWCIWFATETGHVNAQAPPPSGISIVDFAGVVEVSPAGQAAWSRATKGQLLKPGDRVRTRQHSRLALRMSENDTLRFHDITEFQIQPPAAPKRKPGLNLLQGMLYLFHRGRPAEFDITTPTATAAIRGTEFNLEAQPGRTILTMIDGTVELSNEQGPITVNSREQGIAEPGKLPTKSPMLEITTVIQWCFYYPGVLDPGEAGLSGEEAQALTNSFAAYRDGDLQQALAAYPAGRQAASSAEKAYIGALLLAAGQVEQTEALLNAVTPVANLRVGAVAPEKLADALREVIAAVKGTNWQRTQAPQSASEWLAESYYEQSHSRLTNALTAARHAVEKSPRFGFGWERVAELEFSFGHTGKASDALEKSLTLASRNAQAHALQGFLLAARNKIPAAISSFDQAITLDGSLGNAWLGRGLCRIRKGDTLGGREDLQVAATVEPQRSVLRSYLAKAYGNGGDYLRANKEIQLAKELDERDPTAWLYSALLNQQQNRINEAVRDLESSQALNDNRSLYRSRLLLDQDRAVRSANLANIYRDEGMFDVSVREASRAVSYDYANYSAHLFLANSYDQLRDPNRVNLRFDTPAESEYVIANLLSPVGAGTLSQSISQQEYSRLFERDGFGIASTTEYLSRGAWSESGAQFGTFGNFNYALEAFSYRTDPGQRSNNDFEERDLRLHLKYQVTPKDTVYLRTSYYEAEGGDVIQYYDPRSANSLTRVREDQDPVVLVGYHREWGPGSHTLLLAGRLTDRYSLSTPQQETLFVIKPFGTEPVYVQAFPIRLQYRNDLEIYSTELQQIWQQTAHQTIIGGRVQVGEFHTRALQTDPDAGDNRGYFPPNQPAASLEFRPDMQRLSLYGYHYWQILDRLQLVGGLAYDRLTFPQNFRAPPISDKHETREQISPKAGLIWTPLSNAAVRFAYTRSLAGAAIDQTFLIEPSQVAGFNQSFRSIIPESVVGSETGERFETFALSLEQRFPSGTYLGLSGELLEAKVRRSIGAFEYTGETFFVNPGQQREALDYEERVLQFTLNQLIGNGWSVGARYRLTRAELNDNFVEIPDSAFLLNFRPRQKLEATLHQLNTDLIYNHRCGFFADFQALWYLQNNSGYEEPRPGDEFWQFNAFVGYRFPRGLAEVRLGLLNLTDQNYRLNPLTLYNELPRERTLAVRLSFKF